MPSHAVKKLATPTRIVRVWCRACERFSDDDCQTCGGRGWMWVSNLHASQEHLTVVSEPMKGWGRR